MVRRLKAAPPKTLLPYTGRIAIEDVQPQVDHGRFPIKRTVGEEVVVEADIFADGHDLLSAMLLHRHAGDDAWVETPMQLLGNDRWRAAFPITKLSAYQYTIEAWPDAFGTWRRDLQKRLDAALDLSLDLLIGADLLEAAADRASDVDGIQLGVLAQQLRTASTQEGVALASSDEVITLAARYPDRAAGARYELELSVTVDRERARFGAWYELFPRSVMPRAAEHGAFRDCIAKLPDIAAMGFDVLYFPPIHPIGQAHRKGKNNNPIAMPEDVGSPWAIGGAEGGHKAIHPDLGTLDDFRALVQAAAEYHIEIALDIAFQCSPDHPYVQEHPSWFRHRPDGSVQYAENPPKKYEDIYPFDFTSPEWPELWEELKSVVEFWAEQGVRMFRVDNPHTKPFAFWEWLIREVKAQYPDAIFLAEAFTRPKIMYRLAKLGFTQSYTYFAWRNTKSELTQYFGELTATRVREFFRPNLWPNTPDILTERLQNGGRPAFMARLLLAATLGASYGIYGPAFELCEARPRELGSEEYLNSEKYELKYPDVDSPDSLRGLITTVNRIRRRHPALQQDHTLRFHPTDNEQLLAYSKAGPDGRDVILTVVNLDPVYMQSGWTQLDLRALGLTPDQPFTVHDLLTDASYTWRGPRNYIELNPTALPAHIFHVLPAGETA